MKEIFFLSILSYILFEDISAYTNLNYPQQAISSQVSSPFSNFTSLCNCDMTESHCDLFCCCDNDCVPFNYTFNEWRKRGLCKKNVLTSTQIYFDQCLDNPSSYSLTDLSTPVRLFQQGLKTGLCVYTNNAPGNLSSHEIKSIINSQDFNNSLFASLGISGNQVYNNKNYFNKRNNFNFTVASLYNSLFLNPSSATTLAETKFIYNYRAFDPVNLVFPTLNKISTISFPVVSPTGLCEMSDHVRYLRNQDVTSNSLIEHDPNAVMYINSTTVPTRPTFRFFSVDNDNITEVNSFPSPVYQAGSCRNVVRNVEYVFSVNNNTLLGLEIKYYLISLSMADNDVSYLAMNYKAEFIRNSSNFTAKSGNPGYIKGKPILSGWAGSFQLFDNQTGLNKTYQYINQFKVKIKFNKISQRPRIFYGVDKEGACILTSNRQNFINPVILENPDIKNNYDYNYVLQNDITFEDKIQYGCYELLNPAELQTYCQNDHWKNKHLLSMVNNLSYFSRFGNPNSSFISDWVKIQPIDFKSFTSSWDTNFLKCSVPAVMSIDITIADYGMVNNTQSGIVYVSQRINSVDWFVNLGTNLERNKYYSYVEINFWKIKQGTTFWYAPAPPVFPKLPKNLMAPFKVGTTTYGSDSIHLKNTNLTAFVILVFIYIFTF